MGDKKTTKILPVPTPWSTQTISASQWDTEPDALRLSVERILEHVATYGGKKCVQRVDHARLSDELFLRAWPIWRARSTIDHDSRATARRARAELFDDLARSAKRLKRKLLHGSKYVASQIAIRFPATSDFNTFLAGLDRVIESAEDFAQLCGRIGWDPRTPKEQFLAEILPKVFERCFGQKASKSKEGLYNHFASALLKEFGETFSPESVHRARYRKPRRKMQRLRG